MSKTMRTLVLAAGLLLARTAGAQTPVPDGGLVVDAAADGDVARIDALLSAGASPNAASARGYSALYAAVLMDRVPAAERLLRAGATGLDQLHGDRRELLLSLAAWEGSAAMMRLLLAQGADPKALGPDGRDALVGAIARASVEKVGLLLEAGADPNRRLPDGTSGVARAAIHGHADVLALLLDHGGRLEIRDDQGVTPLMFAAAQGREEALALLLERGAHPWPLDTHAQSALACAKRLKDPELRARLVGRLTAAGARDPEPLRPIDLDLFAAVEKGDLPKVKSLVQRGADVHARGTMVGARMYYTILFSAVAHPTVLRYLLDQGVDPHQVTEYRFTALHAAAADGVAESIQVLAALGLDPNARAAGDQTPLSEALNRRGDRPECVAALLKAGADPNGHVAAAQSPLQRAKERRFAGSVRLLEAAGGK
jgi:ankyrin repeat protein